jgi:peptidoglycan/LPS O-acetylase OafA/YrhL
MKQAQSKSNVVRLLDIDRAKGLAILLVVFGHVVARQPPLGNEWYTWAKDAVYAFHMAFFMFLSGVVFFIRAEPLSDIKAFGDFTRKRFMRLMPAYFLFAGIVFMGKLGAQHFVHVDNPADGLSALLDIALFPMQSVAAFLWYIYVLFLFSLAGMILLTVTKGRIWPMLLIGLLLQFLEPIQFLGLGQFFKYFLFFVMGGFAIRYWQNYTAWLDRYWTVALGVLVVFLTTDGHGGNGWIVAALLSLPALHGLCRRDFIGVKILHYIGTLSFAIYLMNTISIGLVKAVMLKFVTWDGMNFPLIFFPALMTAGVLIPIAVKKILFPRLPWLDRITS